MSIGFNKLIASEILNEGYECSLGYYKLNDIVMDVLMKPHENIFNENAEITSAINVNFTDDSDKLFN